MAVAPRPAGAVRDTGGRAVDRPRAHADPARGARRRARAARRRGARSTRCAGSSTGCTSRASTRSASRRRPAPSRAHRARRRARGARDATGEVVEAVDAWGAEAVEPLVYEWRGALFRVRLARLQARRRAAGSARAASLRAAQARGAARARRALALGGAAASSPARRRALARLGRGHGRGLRLGARFTGPSPTAARKPRERLVAAEQLEALEQPRRDLRAGDREPDRRERLARLLPRGSRRARAAPPRSRPPPTARPRRAPRRRRGTISGSAPSGQTGSKRKRTKSGYCENFSIFSCTSGTVARTAPRASRSPARRASAAAPPRTRRLGQRPQVDAVHPVELLVVERRRARHDALEREALDELGGRHDRRLVVVAPAEQREEVHQRRRAGSRPRGTRRPTTAPWRFESFLPSSPKMFGTCA